MFDGVWVSMRSPKWPTRETDGFGNQEQPFRHISVRSCLCTWWVHSIINWKYILTKPPKAIAPATSKITQSGSKAQELIEAVVSLSVRSDVAPDRMIPALALVYAIWTFAGSAALSVAGQAMSRPEGHDNSHPRKHRQSMTGLPLRLMSAHHALMESFPLFASAASLAQGLAPGDQEILNLLGLHVLLKVFVFHPAYVFNIPPMRSLSHLLSISAILRVFWMLAAWASHDEWGGTPDWIERHYCKDLLSICSEPWRVLGITHAKYVVVVYNW